MSRCFSNISKGVDSTTSIDNLFWCSVTLTVSNCFLMFRWKLLCFSVCPLPLVLSLDTTKKEPGCVFFAPSGSESSPYPFSNFLWLVIAVLSSLSRSLCKASLPSQRSPQLLLLYVIVILNVHQFRHPDHL